MPYFSASNASLCFSVFRFQEKRELVPLKVFRAEGALPDDFQSALLDVSLSQNRAIVGEAVGYRAAGATFNHVADATGRAEVSRSTAKSKSVVASDHYKIEVAELIEFHLRRHIGNVDAASHGVAGIDNQAGEDSRCVIEHKEAFGVLIEPACRRGNCFAARGGVSVQNLG